MQSGDAYKHSRVKSVHDSGGGYTTARDGELHSDGRVEWVRQWYTQRLCAGFDRCALESLVERANLRRQPARSSKPLYSGRRREVAAPKDERRLSQY